MNSSTMRARATTHRAEVTSLLAGAVAFRDGLDDRTLGAFAALWPGLAAGTRFGPYEIEAPLGKRGMGRSIAPA
jgi:hypothetical protein